MNIAELATRARVPRRTVRYYADRGFIRPVRRTEGGYRLFGEDALRRLRFIRRGQTLGLPLREIVALAVTAERQSCAEATRTIVARLRQQLGAIERRIAELEAVRDDLGGVVASERTQCSDELCLCQGPVSASACSSGTGICTG